MIIYNKPDVKSLSPKSLNDILSKGVRDLYMIENSIQRPFVWGTRNIEPWWSEYIELCHINFSKRDSDYFDYAFMDFGSLDYSVLEPNNQEKCVKENGVLYKSLVDGSQRVRLALCSYIALILWRAELNDDEYIDMLNFKSTDGFLKVIDFGDAKLKPFYDYISSTPVKKIIKNCPTIEKCEKIFENDTDEKKIKDLFFYAIRLVEKSIIECDLSIDKCVRILLNNVYLYEENIPYNYKFTRFVDRNNREAPMTEEHLFPKFIINNFTDKDIEPIYKSYVEFEKEAKKCEERGNESFIRTKKGKHAILFFMEESLKVMLGRNGHSKAFKSDFSLRDVTYGIEACINNKYLFTTPENAIEYFNECKNMAIFIHQESMKEHDNFYDNCYMFRNFTESSVVWWYFIKPCYIMNRILPFDKRKFAKDLLFRSGYIHYCVVRVAIGSTNSQNLINALEKVSYEMINNKDEDIIKFKTILSNIMYGYTQKIEPSWEKVGIAIRNLSYTIRSHRGAIEKILIALEYDIITKFNLNNDKFFEFWSRKKKQIKRTTKQSNIDHWYPESLSMENDELYDVCSRIGNFTLLESNLNESKGNDNTKTHTTYFQSGYNITKYMCDDFTGDMSSIEKLELSKHNYFQRFSKDKITAPTIDDIKIRTKTLSAFVVDFIKTPLID